MSMPEALPPLSDYDRVTVHYLVSVAEFFAENPTVIEKFVRLCVKSKNRALLMRNRALLEDCIRLLEQMEE
jgi:hypothetical protein